MSKESDYIINQINQAPKDFKGNESDFIIDKIKQFNDHEILWSVFVGEPKGKDYEAFVNASISEKEQMLKSKANDTDDALWRTKEWMKISGNSEAEKDYIPSALEYVKPFMQGLPQGDTIMPEDFR
tara:strand:+ start:89 stop:466 length:378 start_codon:yes stop_codon:yes gene_type:complete